MQTTVSPADYIERLRALAADTDPIQRFYLFQEDDLYEMESVLADSPQSEEFYEALMAEYRTWSDEMGGEGWNEVLAHNDSLNGANRNWLLDEL